MAEVWSQGGSQQSSRTSMMWQMDESLSNNMSDFSASPDSEEVRPIRRVQSPSSLRARPPTFYKPKPKGHVYNPGYTNKGYPSRKPIRGGVSGGSQRHHHGSTREYKDRKEYYHLKLQHQKWEQEKKRNWYQSRKSLDPRLAPKPSSANRTGSPWTSSIRDQGDKRDQGIRAETALSEKYQKRTREREQRTTSSKEAGHGRECEPPPTVSLTTARDRAIQKKRKEIDEVYNQECEMFGLVTKMLIQKDQSLELPIQTALQENLRDIGKRCVEAMERFIEEYDSQH